MNSGYRSNFLFFFFFVVVVTYSILSFKTGHSVSPLERINNSTKDLGCDVALRSFNKPTTDYITRHIPLFPSQDLP